MLKLTRQILAAVSIVLVTLLFLDFTGTSAKLFGWLAKIQFLPALLALNFVVLSGLLVLTLLLGRVYCSVICPLGIMQDIFARFGKIIKTNRYSYSPPRNILRYSMLAVMSLAVIFGFHILVALLAPYSAYGRIVRSLLSPLWIWGNNLLAVWSETVDNFIFYNVEAPYFSAFTLGTAVVTVVTLFILAWRNGRTYCNTVCPVGTLLGFFSRFSLFRPIIDITKCNSCGLCARNCKAACIDSKEHKIDYSRCVACMDCIGKCHKNAISYSWRRDFTPSVTMSPGTSSNPSFRKVDDSVDGSRRNFLAVTALIGTTAVVQSADKIVDGGLAEIEKKAIPNRHTRIVPPGALSLRNMERHCTACQLCVSECPNGVLRPSGDLMSLMQPVASYENGYCRPECTRCSNVCPTGAIRPVGRDDKSSIQIGHAVWIKENCIPLTDDVECGNCARHCPVGAIIMVPSVQGVENSRKIPVVNTERCIGCGACENLCPARPFSAIYVEGHENHRII